MGKTRNLHKLKCTLFLEKLIFKDLDQITEDIYKNKMHKGNYIKRVFIGVISRCFSLQKYPYWAIKFNVERKCFLHDIQQRCNSRILAKN